MIDLDDSFFTDETLAMTSMSASGMEGDHAAIQQDMVAISSDCDDRQLLSSSSPSPSSAEVMIKSNPQRLKENPGDASAIQSRENNRPDQSVWICSKPRSVSPLTPSASSKTPDATPENGSENLITRNNSDLSFFSAHSLPADHRRQSLNRPMVIRSMSTGLSSAPRDENGMIMCISNHSERVFSNNALSQRGPSVSRSHPDPTKDSDALPNPHRLEPEYTSIPVLDKVSGLRHLPSRSHSSPPVSAWKCVTEALLSSSSPSAGPVRTGSAPQTVHSPTPLRGDERRHGEFHW